MLSLPQAEEIQSIGEQLVPLVATRASKISLWDRLPRYDEHFCDVTLRSLEGEEFKAHRLILSMSSEVLFAMLSGSFAEGHQSEVPFEFSSEAVRTFIGFLYNGEAQVKKTVLPELLRLAHQWDVQPLQCSLTTLLVENMTPELCSTLIVHCELLLADEVDEMLEGFAQRHFAECVNTQDFGSWPLHRLIGLLRSDDLVVDSEEAVLAAVLQWHQSRPGREDATAALLQMVRFALFSVTSLQSLQAKEGLPGLPGIVVSRLATMALKIHNGIVTPDGTYEYPFVGRIPKLRREYTFWWADFGCSIRGGTVAAERRTDTREESENELEPWAVHIYGDCLYIIDGREPCCVLQWPLGAKSGRVAVGAGSTLNGVNDFSDILDIALDDAGDLYVLDGQHGRIVRIHDGVGRVVGEGNLVLDGTRALFVDSAGAIYFIDEGGSCVKKYFQGKTYSAAGQPESGNGPQHLEDAEDLFVTADGSLYISDSGNNRIQKWPLGAKEGITVAGGNGQGCRLDQLNHPVGLFVTEDRSIYSADYQNHRVMKWREGWATGLIVAGGYGGDSGLHQLCEPIDVTIDPSGALYIADNGNARVVRWASSHHVCEASATAF